MKHYTEKSYSFEVHASSGFIIDFLSLIVISPFRMCNELSIKIMLLPRKELIRLLSVATGIGCSSFILSFLDFRKYGKFSFWLSKFPFAVQLVSSAILGLMLFITVAQVDNITKHLDRIKQRSVCKNTPRGSTVSVEESASFGEEISFDDLQSQVESTIQQGVEEATQFSDTGDIALADLLDDRQPGSSEQKEKSPVSSVADEFLRDEVESMCSLHPIESKMNLSPAELDHLSDLIYKNCESGKFFSHDLIEEFANEINNVDTFGSLEVIGLGCLPATLKNLGGMLL